MTSLSGRVGAGNRLLASAISPRDPPTAVVWGEHRLQPRAVSKVDRPERSASPSPEGKSPTPKSRALHQPARITAPGCKTVVLHSSLTQSVRDRTYPLPTKLPSLPLLPRRKRNGSSCLICCAWEEPS